MQDVQYIPPWIRTLVIWIISSCWSIHANHDAKRLYDDLLRKNNYNKLIRPVGNTSEKLVIKLGLKLSQVIDVVSMMLKCYSREYKIM